jgi:hypothetical protein
MKPVLDTAKQASEDLVAAMHHLRIELTNLHEQVDFLSWLTLIGFGLALIGFMVHRHKINRLTERLERLEGKADAKPRT